MNWSLINEQRIFAFAMASLACMPHHLLSANKHSGLLAKDYQRQMENPKYRKRDGRENAGRENLSQIVRHSVWFIDIEFGAMFGCAISISGHFRIVGVFFSFHFTSLLFGWYAVIEWLFVEWMKRNLGEMLLGKTNVANNCKFPEKKYVVSIGMKMKFRMAIVVDSNGP